MTGVETATIRDGGRIGGARRGDGSVMQWGRPGGGKKRWGDGEDRARDSSSGGEHEGRGYSHRVGMAVRLWGLEAAESSASRSHRRPERQSAFWRTARKRQSGLTISTRHSSTLTP